MTAIIRGIQRKPLSLVIYGVPGVGKSKYAEGFPNPIFVGTEENDELTAARFPVVKSYVQMIRYLGELIKGQHKGYKTVVIDSISGLEKIIHSEICGNDKTMASAHGGYGKAYDFAAIQLWRIKGMLETLRDKTRYNIVVIGHATTTHFTDPVLQTDYEVWEMNLHKNKRRDCNAYFTEWASAVFFLNWATYKKTEEKFVVGTGARELFTEFRPSHLAKNRFGLPHKIKLEEGGPGEAGKNWKILRDHLVKFYESGKKTQETAAKADQKNQDNILIHRNKGLLEDLEMDAVKKKPLIEAHIKTMEELGKNPKKGREMMKKLHERLTKIVQNQ